MKKWMKVILSILLTISFLLITMSFILENTVVKTFSQEILSKKISGYFLDEIIYDMDIDQLQRIEDNIRNSRYTDKITSKFIQTIVKNVGYDKDIEFDVSEEIDVLVLENMPQEFYNEKGDAAKEYLNENIGAIEKNLEENLIRALGKPYLTILKLYDALTSIYFRVAMMLICIVTIIVLARIEKAKALRTFQISSIVTMTVTFLAFISIKLLSNFIDQRFAGGWLSSINLGLMFLFIILEGVISLVLFMLRKNRNSNG